MCIRDRPEGAAPSREAEEIGPSGSASDPGTGGRRHSGIDVGSAGFGDAWGCGCQDSRRRSGAELGSAGGKGQHGGLGTPRRPGARLGSACRITATCRGTAAATPATTPSNDTQLRSAGTDMGRAGTVGSARRTHLNRPGGSDLGCCSPGPATAAGTRAILGCTWSRRPGRTAGPHLGLARACSVLVGAASATVLGCAEARSPTPAGGAVVGQ